MKILLIVPSLDFRYSIRKTYVPLGVAYIAAVLREARHEICFLDVNVTGTENLEKELMTTVDFDIVGITVLFNSFCFIEQVTSRIREINPSIPIILGGPLVSSAPKTVMENTSANIAVLGEGEDTIVELVDALSKKRNLEKIQGICYKNNDGNLCFTSPRPRIENLDRIPFPAFDLFDLGSYFKSKPKLPTLNQIGPHLPLMTHRGCVHHCKFCLIPQIWPTVSLRSIKNVIEELNWQEKNFGVKGVTVTDDNFGPSEERIRLFCQDLIETGLKIGFKCLMRATTVNRLDISTLLLMKNAGCKVVRIGIESGEKKTLRKTAKGVSLEDVERAIKRIQDFGFSPDGSFLMIGHPDETEESLEHTMKFISKLGIKILTFFAIPLPGTPWYQQVREKGLIPDEVKFLRELQFWQERPVVNISQVSNEKLIESLKILKTWND